MKLRVISLVLSILLLISFSACGGEGSASDLDTSSQVSQDTSENNSDSSSGPDTSTDTSEPITPPEEPDFFTKHGHSQVPAPSELPQYLSSTETDYLYQCDFELPPSEGYNIQIINGILQLSYWNECEEFVMISLETGELVNRITLDYWNFHGRLSDGRIWAVSGDNLAVTVYDHNGSETVFQGKSEMPQDVALLTAEVTSDGKYMLVLYDIAPPELYNLETGTCTNPNFKENSDLYILETCEDGFVLSVNDEYVFFEAATGNITPMPEYAYDNGTAYGDLSSFYKDGTLVLGTDDENAERFYMDMATNEMLGDVEFGCAVTHDQTYISPVVNIYDLRNGTHVSALEFSETDYNTFAAILDDGTVFILVSGENGSSTYIYDLPSAIANEIGTPAETIIMTKQQLSEKTDELALETEEKIGIDLLYGSQGNDFIIGEYTGVVALDPYDVYQAVGTVSEVLLKYPENMLREACQPNYRGLQLYLSGNIFGRGDVSVAGGVTTEYDGYIVIALDIYSYIETDLPHELSHAFDRRIDYAMTQGNDWHSVWLSATPFEDAYSYTYADYTDNQKYTYWEEDDKDDVWFVDSYARTFPTEDRARIMENLFNPKDGKIAEEFQCQHLLDKAKLYAYILRQCFSSCNTDQPLYWETYLGTIDESVLP